MAFVKEVMAALVWKGDYIRIRTADRKPHAVLVESVVLSSANQVEITFRFPDGSSAKESWRKVDMLSVYLSVPAPFRDMGVKAF